MTEEWRWPLGRHRGRTYYLQLRVTPGFDDRTDFAALVFFRRPHDGETVAVARIDTSHGFVHFDRLYRRDQPKDPIDVDAWEAAELLETNWRHYARSHDRAHGR